MRHRWTCITAIFLMLIASFSAQTVAATETIHRQKRCGDLVLTADTTVINPSDDLFTQGLAQTIHLYNSKTYIDRNVPIFQHRSRNRDFGGKLMVDALVYQWNCLRSNSGRTYFELSAACHNPYAKTCSIAQGFAKNEWSVIYDDQGDSLSEFPYELPEEQKKLERSLGLWSDYARDVEQDGGYVFWK